MRFGKARKGFCAEVADRGEGLIVKAYDVGLVGGVEMTGDRIANHDLQVVEGIGLREYGKAERPRFIATFGRLLNGENDFGCSHEPILHGNCFVRTEEYGFNTERAEIRARRAQRRPAGIHGGQEAAGFLEGDGLHPAGVDVGHPGGDWLVMVEIEEVAVEVLDGELAEAPRLSFERVDDVRA